MSATTATIPHVWKPSSARCVVLDGFLPVPRGAAVPPPAPLTWAAKDPSDVLDYEIDASQALFGNDGDVIASIAVAIQPPGELVPGQMLADGTTAVVWLSGGAAGTTYVVQVTIGTAAGRTIGRAILLPVHSLANPTSAVGGSTYTLGNALTTQAGAVVTDQNGAPILVNG